MSYKLSPSSLGLMKECPRCFWLHFNKKIKRPDSIFPSLPSGMDSILKAHFDSFRDKGLLPPELHELKGLKLFGNLELLEVWRNNFKGIQWKGKDGNILRGAVDDILEKKSKLIVLDFKTRGFPLKEDTHEHYQDQLDIYNFLLRQNDYETEDYAYLLFYYPEKVNGNGDIVFHTSLIEMEIAVKNAEHIFKEALKVLGGKIPKVSEECGFCEWGKTNNLY